MKRYKVSVVTPVYNVEDYLEECIESVVNQTIGFDDNIQLILINDGSPDGSDLICRKYKDMYPDNIVYIKKDNTGVSNSRNIGIDAASGEYVSFLDSDDKLSADYYENICRLMDTNREVPFAVGRMRMFDAVDKFHATDYRFDSTRVINLNSSPNMPQSAIAPLVCRASQLGSVRFDESMSHLEDAKFIDSLLLECGVYMYGAVRESTYYYRKRQDASSASDTALRRHSYYSSLNNYFKFLTESIIKNDLSIGFIEYNALYRIGWSIDKPQKPDVLNGDEWREHKRILKGLVRVLSDDVILEGGASINLRRKLTLLRVKYSKSSLSEKKDIIHKLVSEQAVYVTNINHRGDRGIVMDGEIYLSDKSLSGLNLEILLDGKPVTYIKSNRYVNFLDEEMVFSSGFNLAVDKGFRGDIVFRISDGDISIDLEVVYARTARVGMRRYDYRLLKASVAILPFHRRIRLADFRIRNLILRELGLFLQSVFVNKYNIPRNVLKTVFIEFIRLAVLFRMRLLGSSRVWLFSDRTVSGGDNSEALFRYASEQGDVDVKPYYVINRDTAAYRKLKDEGYSVVAYRSFRHLYLSIVCEMMLTSHLDEIYFYPWHALHHKYFGLSQFDIVHTQHGIALNDMSSYVGKFSKDATIFLSVCSWEQERLLGDKYGYERWQVPVTGLPRYDSLIDSSNHRKDRVISIHPTWRPWVSGENRDGKRLKNTDFSNTDYYNFYQDLINNKILLDAVEARGYRLRFYIHPNHASNVDDFSSVSDRVDIMKFPYDYTKMLSESNLLVTDYSNIVFDFLYLRKPIIYTHFDSEEFFSRHGAMISGRTFDYKKDGMGLVVEDIDNTVSKIISYIDKDFSLESVYRRRIESFFDYSDSNGSKRAYRYIIKYVRKIRKALR